MPRLLSPGRCFVIVVLGLSALIAGITFDSGGAVPSLISLQNQSLGQGQLPACPPTGCGPAPPNQVPFYVLLNGSMTSPTYKVVRGQMITVIADIESNESLLVNVLAYHQILPSVGPTVPGFVANSTGIIVTLPFNTRNLRIGSNSFEMKIVIAPNAKLGVHPMDLRVDYSTSTGRAGFLAGFDLNVEG